MISKFLYALQRGGRKVQQNSKLSFLAIILFIFPTLFMLVLERFDEVAQANIQTLELSQINAQHDSLAAVLPLVGPSELSTLLTQFEQSAPGLQVVRVYTVDNSGAYQVVASSNEDEINTIDATSTVFQLAKITPNESFTVPFKSELGRTEQSVRLVTSGEGSFYIFSEYSRGQTDNILANRKQDAYILLSLIFVFVIALAYWINRQSDWERRYYKLHSTLKERDLFTNMIAHEFRTPLTAIKGYASFLQDSSALPDEERRYADTIRESAERLVLLVNDFLEIARIQSGRMNMEPAQVDVRQTIATVVKTLQQEVVTKELVLVYTPALQPQILHTDEDRVVQVLTNIITNSIKYTNKGTIEVTCDVNRSGLSIRVKDTGMGISAEDQKKLFAPFARVGGVEHTTTTGTGLGMWITKQMIELLGGTISVESIKGVGTHVVIELTDISAKD